MRNVLIALVASLAVASPALANEGRIEARGGIAWASGTSEAIAGAAAGYDFDLGEKAFIGGEVSADKVLQGGSHVIFGLTGRVGAKTSEDGKFFVNGGYSDDFQSGGGHAWHAGAGYEHRFGSSLYGKVEYRHFFVDGGGDSNAAVVGLGVKF